MRTVPESTRSRPAITISSVDLPEPDGPTMPVASPRATSRLTPFSTCTSEAPSPSVSDTSFNAMTGSVTENRPYIGVKDCAWSVTYGLLSMAFKLSLRAFLAAGFLFLAGFAAIAEPYRIVGFGDSLMAGFGLNPGEGFPEKLQAALKARGHDVEVINAGVSGDTIQRRPVAARLVGARRHARLVILELGANDMLRGHHARDNREEPRRDAGQAEGSDKSPCSLAGMRAAPNLGADYQASVRCDLPAACRKIRRCALPLLPRRRRCRARSCCWQDGMHPSAKGVDIMVERILPAVEKLIAANPDNS